MAKSITWHESNGAAFHLLKSKLKAKCPKKHQEVKTVAVEAWQSITRDETQRLVMSLGSRLQASLTAKDFQQSIKIDNFNDDYISLSNYFWFLKKEVPHIKCVVIPTAFTWCGCKFPQIKAESLLLKHIMIVSFKIHYGGVQSPNDENGVNVQIFMDLTV